MTAALEHDSHDGVMRMTDCSTGTHPLLVSEGIVQMQEHDANQLHGDDASGRPAVAPAIHDDREAAEPGPAEASDAEPASSSWDQAPSDAPAASPGKSAHPPQDPLEDPQIAASMDIPAPGTPVDESALENHVDEIFRQLINDAAIEMGPRVQPAPLQPAANVDIVDGLLRLTMEEPIGEVGPQVQPAPLQPSGNANQPTRALSGRRPPRTLRHMAPREPSPAQAAPNASSDMTFSAAAFVLYALALGQAGMQPSSEAAAVAQTLDDVRTSKVGSAAAGDDAVADALIVEGKEAGSTSEADSSIGRDAATDNVEAKQDAGITRAEGASNKCTVSGDTEVLQKTNVSVFGEAVSRAAAIEDAEMNGEATFTGPEGTAGTEAATGLAQETKDAGNIGPQGASGRNHVIDDASAAESAAADSSTGTAALVSIADSSTAAASAQGNDYAPHQPPSDTTPSHQTPQGTYLPQSGHPQAQVTAGNLTDQITFCSTQYNFYLIFIMFCMGAKTAATSMN